MVLTFEEQMYIAIGALFLTVLICFILLIIVSVKYSNLRKKVMSGKDDALLEEVESGDFYEGELPEDSAENKSKIEELEKKIEELQAKQQKAFDKIKVLRYNQTLPDGNQSETFSIGITNQILEGIVLTGAGMPDGATNLVVKSVRNGESNVELTEAEQVAVTRKGEKK